MFFVAYLVHGTVDSIGCCIFIFPQISFGVRPKTRQVKKSVIRLSLGKLLLVNLLQVIKQTNNSPTISLKMASSTDHGLFWGRVCLFITDSVSLFITVKTDMSTHLHPA